VPTNAELTSLVTAAGITNSATAAASKLRFSVAGYRSYSNGTLYHTGDSGYYWSSSVSGSTNASNRYFGSGSTGTNSSGRANGFFVRCLGN
jgi:hypothetical protein